MNLDEIIGFDALYESMNKCRSGVLWKDSTANYFLHSVSRTSALAKALADGTYKPKDTMKFKITSPKPREIASVMFVDRVYQRSLNDNYIYPTMCKSFIYDNCACQKGKGTDFARSRLKTFLQKCYRKHGLNAYVLQLDISGYYPNMSHKAVEDMFRKKLHPTVAKMTVDILHHQYEGDKGYNPGSQLIQIAGISILDNLDHYIKERLRIKWYVRYMDDLIMIHSDGNYLKECMEVIRTKLEELGFCINQKKSKIYPLKEGISFLGFKFSLTETGKVLMNVDPRNVKRERLKLRRLVRKSKDGKIPREKVDESYNAWRNHASKGNSFKLLQRMDAYYKDLWGDINVQTE